MSRVGKVPLEIPASVQFEQNGNVITIKGKKGSFSHTLHPAVVVKLDNKIVTVKAKAETHPMVGTTRKLLGNFVHGVSEGFESKLQLVGVGYRAKVSGAGLELSLGFSHPVVFAIPQGITIEAPSNTDLIIKGADKQQVGEVAAKIRAVRPPERYKGKGVRYANEVVELKETKKK